MAKVFLVTMGFLLLLIIGMFYEDRVKFSAEQNRKSAAAIGTPPAKEQEAILVRKGDPGSLPASKKEAAKKVTHETPADAPPSPSPRNNTDVAISANEVSSIPAPSQKAEATKQQEKSQEKNVLETSASNDFVWKDLPFRELIKYTETEAQQLALWREKYKQWIPSNPSAFFGWLADTDVPIPPWRPGKADPIICNGKEYYAAHFSIPAENFIEEPAEKTKAWATVVPGRKETYLFKKEAEYRRDLETSMFAITRRRFGFATNRNLEIMAAGGVPFFCGIEKVPKIGTLASLPKDAFQAIVYFPGVRARCQPHKKALGLPIDEGLFNKTQYRRLNQKMLDYAKTSMDTTFHAMYVLSATSLKQLPKKVLVLWASHYTIVLTGLIHGLRKLGIKVEDVPRRPEIYKGEGCEEAREKTYAKGWFFFCKATESKGLKRENIKERIEAKEFDLIIISVTDTLTYYMKNPSTDIPHYDTILASYPRDRIVTINDADLIKPMTADVAHGFMHNTTLYFKRETHGCHENIW